MKSYRDYPKINNDRINFSKIGGTLELPYLVEIQTESYKNFLDYGIEEVFKDVFPIDNYAGNMSVVYNSFRLDEPKHTFLECKEKDLTYSAPLTVNLRLLDKTTGEFVDSDVFMGEIPLMTESGTFIVNGAERVIVSQIVRSPGAYLSKTFDNKFGKYVYNADLIPSRGTWLEFESDVKGILWVRIDRQRKMPATILLKALGIDKNEDIFALFGERDSLKLTLGKEGSITSSTIALKEIFRKLKPGEPITEDGVHSFIVQKFFDAKRYDLGRAGRFKYAKKLGIYNRLIGRYLAEDLVDVNGVSKYTKGTYLTKEMVDALEEEEFFEKGAHTYDININTRLDEYGTVNMVKVYANEKKDVISNVIGTDLNLSVSRVTISDMIAIFSYFMNLMDGFGSVDDIDNLSNRRIRAVGELIQTQFRIGLTKMAKNITSKMTVTTGETKEITPKSLINIRPLASAIREFFASSQLSQFMDQTNPLAELANKRRISALGPGGITRDRASMEVRDVHFTHYGRICPIETPEGQNIGLINNLATYAKINKYGFIETPYRLVDKETGNILEKTVYLSADEELNHVIAQATREDIKDHKLANDKVVARYNGKNILADKKDVDYIDESPKQIVSVAAACIPFLENDDNTRALMGANMQRQALPLLKPHAPFVGTGIEHNIAHDCGLAVVAGNDGVCTYVDSTQIKVKEENGVRTYQLQKYERSNQGTCINQRSIVKIGDSIKKGQIIADGPSMDNGDLALGQNVVVAFMTWEGLNYEDAVIMSERLVKDDVYTTIHIESYEIECRDTKNGAEVITPDVPNQGIDAKAHLDDDGIVYPGTDVKEGDILVGKVTPKGSSEPAPDQKILDAILGDRSKDGKDTSLRVPHGGAGTVLDVKVFTRENGDELSPGVLKKVRVYVAQKRKISEGDKMSGRHGNKGVISRIVPVEDMPYLPDGTPVDILLNPQGVPSRMNIGQILEVHLGMACKALGGLKVATPVFDGISNDEIMEMMKEAKMPSDGKYTLYDGRTGEKFDDRINVGVMYMIKLVHMVDDKLHARATGPYSMVTQQPLGGKAQNGGQRFGEMEVWALEAYGAANILQEMITIKSDDRVGRRKTYEAIIKGKPLPKPSIPEAFKVLTKELMGLGMDVELFGKDGKVIDMDSLARQTQQEEQRSMRAVRNIGNENSSTEKNSEVYDDVDVLDTQVADELFN
ncbi:MAG: DNA-directed RNA polymerase subunit beta [bacterium]|nr:DNA-directed RNA polymerase subunit beta [bacterium]MDY4158724.1 DNA-directed RNA polymerase subunit beta [Candidatus Onthovivens sp.]